MPNTCKALGCVKAAHSLGYCSLHGNRFKRYGDPFAGPTLKNTITAWIGGALVTETDECIVWPFNTTTKGYPSARINEKQALAHRHMCTLAHGEPPSEGLHAAHECGNRRCMNKRHLSWKTPKENEQDKFRHGTRKIGVSPSAKLTAEKVYGMRLMVKAGASCASTAEAFGVSRVAGWAAATGKTWKHVGMP